MDALTQAALVGTVRAGGALPGDTPASGLVGSAEARDQERALLLRAGAEAVFRLAGTQPSHLATTLDVAPAESLPVCSPKAAALLHELMVGKHSGVAAEAARRLKEIGQRLPPTLLPLAISVHLDLSVLGERGKWLAQFTKAGQWDLYQYRLRSGVPNLDDAHRIWREGGKDERREILQAMRRYDPATARTWLTADWKREKADFREAALRTLHEGLSLADEPFLESALDDRAETVRRNAAQLLAHLPQSAFAQRMIARVDPLLDYHGPSQTLRVTLPDTYLPEWERDGISPERKQESLTAVPPSSWGSRAWWFFQMLAGVPPTHWEKRFAVDAPTLVHAATANNDWGITVLNGWNRAAVAYKTPAWAPPLLEWEFGLIGQGKSPRSREESPGAPLWMLSRLMQAGESERLTIRLLRDVPLDDERWNLAVTSLKTPWTSEFGTFYLDTLEAQYATAQVQKDGSHIWFHALHRAAEALPPECLAQAQIEWPYVEANDPRLERWHQHQWNRAVLAFKEIVRLRQRIYQEITP